MKNENNKNVRVWVCFKGNPKTMRYVLGNYHECVKTTYITESQYNDILRKYGAKPGDVFPVKGKNRSDIKIIFEKGTTATWDSHYCNVV